MTIQSATAAENIVNPWDTIPYPWENTQNTPEQDTQNITMDTIDMIAFTILMNMTGILIGMITVITMTVDAGMIDMQNLISAVRETASIPFQLFSDLNTTIADTITG